MGTILHFPRRSLRGRVSVCLTLAGSAALVLLPGSAHAATQTWTHGAADVLWSSAPNWQSGVVPVAGDTVTLPSGAAAIMTNDLVFSAGSPLGGLHVTGSGYVLEGNDIHLGAGGIISGGTNSIDAALRLTASQSWSEANTNLTIADADIGSHTLTLTQTGFGSFTFEQLSGTGSVETSASVNIAGSSNMSYSGVFNVHSQALTVYTQVKSADVHIHSGSLQPAGGGVDQVTIDGVNSSMNIGAPGSMDMNELTVSGGDVSIDASGACAHHVAVNGNVELTDATFIVANAPGDPAVGTVCTVFDVSGGTVTGTFNNLPEGATIVGDTVNYVISYVGGAGGHSVALTVTDKPGSPVDDTDDDPRGDDSGGGTGTLDGELPATGPEFAAPVASVALLLVLAGTAVLAIRRRTELG